jgi:hypothetical protein
MDESKLGDEDYSKAINLLIDINMAISNNKCNKPKDIGDRVLVWDASYNVDLKTGKSYSGIDEIFKNPGIIIEKDCNYEYVDPIFHEKERLDIVVYFQKHDAKVATQMDSVKLYK